METTLLKRLNLLSRVSAKTGFGKSAIFVASKRGGLFISVGYIYTPEPIVRARILTARARPTDRRRAKVVFDAGQGPSREQGGNDLRRACVMQRRVSHVALEIDVEARLY